MADGDDPRGPSDPDSMGVYFAPLEMRYTTAASDAIEGDDRICVLSVGIKFLYVLPGFDVLAIELHHLKVKGFPKGSAEDIYDVFIKNDATLFRSYPAVMMIQDLTVIIV